MNKRSPWLYIPTLYFAEGLPFTVVMMMSAVYFKDLDASNTLIGLTSALQAPWIFKFAFAPLVDFIGRKKNWIVVAQAVLAVFFAFLAATTMSANPVTLGIAALGLIAVASAVHDVSIDGYYLEALNKSEQALFVGVRNTAFRMAMIFGNGAMIFLAGWLAQQGLKKQEGWLIAFAVLTAVMAAAAALHIWYLPLKKQQNAEAEIEAKKKQELALASAAVSAAPAAAISLTEQPGPIPDQRGGSSIPASSQLAEEMPGKSIHSSAGSAAANSPPENPQLNLKEYFRAIASYFEQPGIIAIVLYILLFRLGDALVMKQIPPFLQDKLARGGMALSLEEIGLVYGTVGVGCLLLGGIVGGILVSKQGVRKWLWPATLFMNGTILLYWILALTRPSMPWVYLVNSLEQFGYGLGMAAYTVFMLGTVKQEFKAAHYAVATALMALGLMLPGMASGYIYEAVGYANFFLLSFLASVPGMITICFLPLWQIEQQQRSDS